jgi:hypothetical protein
MHEIDLRRFDLNLLVVFEVLLVERNVELVATLVQPEPQLAFTFSAGQVRLLWPALAGPFHLEETTNLAPPAIWSPATNALTNDGYWNEVRALNHSTSSQRFFRLRRD